MGRYNPETVKDYNPGLELNLRIKNEGGGLRSSADPDVIQGRIEFRKRRECLVLVHGFNNNFSDAVTEYTGFRKCQYRNFPSLIEPELEKILADSFWPGDGEWGIVDFMDFGVYPFAVKKARETGPLLAEVIMQIPGLERVYFLGHSLGCRVVLETITALMEKSSLNIGGICFMAAAVQNNMVTPGGRFDDLLYNLQNEKVKILILHSKNDLVLRMAFPPGQTLAFEGFFPSALGYKPTPDMIGYIEKKEIVKASHSDYWGHVEGLKSAEATYFAGGFFKLGSIERNFTSRYPGTERDVGSERSINERQCQSL